MVSDILLLSTLYFNLTCVCAIQIIQLIIIIIIILIIRLTVIGNQLANRLAACRMGRNQVGGRGGRNVRGSGTCAGGQEMGTTNY